MSIQLSMPSTSKILIAGHRGMVGSAIVRLLEKSGYSSLLLPARSELDFRDQTGVHAYIEQEKPEFVILAAAKVGGIQANKTYPAEFIYDNLAIQLNIIHGSYLAGVKNLLFLGSSCIYPKLAEQPMKEGALLAGKLEPTNEPYALAKISGIKLCESYNRQYGTDYRSVMPSNLYGPGDNFHLENSHVIPALIRKFHEAKLQAASTVEVWGSGKAMREFLYVDDMASACIHVLNLGKPIYDKAVEPMCSHINVGSGAEVSIGELAQTVREVVGFEGDIYFDTNKPDGAPRKLMDSTLLAKFGWEAEYNLKRGLQHSYAWFLENENALRL